MTTVRVLLIEDNPVCRELQEMVLRRAGFDVTATASGEDGVASALENPPDIILCDMDLTKGNGYEVASRCKLDKLLRSIPLVAITGTHGIFANREAALEVGFDELLVKPLDIHLADKVASFLPEGKRPLKCRTV